MSDLMLGVGQMLAVAVIVGGVSVALWQVWVLANKLGRNRDRDAFAAPAESHAHITDRRQSRISFEPDKRIRERPNAR